MKQPSLLLVGLLLLAAAPSRAVDPESAARGKIHAQIYPVTVTGTLMPYRPFVNFLESPATNPMKAFLKKMFKNLAGFDSADKAFHWLGLSHYPALGDKGVYAIPYPNGVRPDHRLGLTLRDTKDGQGFTFSCAACHAANLFGKTVLGLGNRISRGNEFVMKAKEATETVGLRLFQAATDATDGETAMFAAAKKRLQAVGARKPQAFGLDTSLAQVALSLARREDDAWATFSEALEKRPRPEPLAERAADSRPPSWWTVKYKDRWLLDGAMVKGDPILTNLLWNEVGRGTDLHELDRWIDESGDVVRDLWSAVLSSEPPRYTDFFPAETIDLGSARRGEALFESRCARCHGHYEKAWSRPGSDELPLAERLRTLKVDYPRPTPVVDVGTDPARRRGMASLERALNPLALSVKHGIVLETQGGYVPPPLEGVWARWPYFHNAAAPTLCAVLTRAGERPASYYAGEAVSAATDFDRACNGYPAEDAAPAAWKKPELRFDSAKEGLSREGHDEGIFLENGVEILSSADKADLVRFLQTL